MSALRFSAGRDAKRSPPHDHTEHALTVQQLATRLRSPAVGPKGSAGYYLPAPFAAGKRGKGDAIGPAAFLWLDADEGTPRERIEEVMPLGCAWIAHTTASHSEAKAKWRIIIPLGEPLPVMEWALAELGAMRWFENVGEELDACTERLNQPIYWPTINTRGALFDWIYHAAPLLAGDDLAQLIEPERQRVEAREVAELERRDEAKRKREARKASGEQSPIDAWNEGHPSIATEFEHHGYRGPFGGRWVHPESTSGRAAVSILDSYAPQRWRSWRGSDHHTDRASGDAFDLLRIHKHGGDERAAVKAAGAWMRAQQGGQAVRRDLEVIDGGQTAEAKPNAGEKSERKRWPFFTVGQARGDAGAEYLVDDLIHAGTLGEIFGPDATLKTQLGLDLAARGATGEAFFDRKVNPFATVFVAAEGSGGIERRVNALRLTHPEIPKHAIIVVPQMVDLTAEEDVQAFTAQVLEQFLPMLEFRLGMFWFDTWAQSTPGADENNAGDFSNAEMNLRTMIRRTGAAQDGFAPAVGVVHHSGWTAARARGTSAHKRNVDWMLECARSDSGDSIPLEERTYVATVRKVKDGPDSAQFPYRGKLVQTGTRDDGEPLVAPVLVPISWSEHREAKTTGKAWAPSPNSWHECLELSMGALLQLHHEHVPDEVLAAEGWGEKHDGVARGVKRSDLIEYALKQRGEDSPDTKPGRAMSDKSRPLRRALDKLQDCGRIHCFEEWVWWPGG